MFLQMLSLLIVLFPLALLCSIFLFSAFLPVLLEGGWQSAFAALPILGAVVSGKGITDLYRRLKSRKQPLVLLDERGVHLWEPDESILPWAAVTSAKVQRVGKANYLLLGVTERERYLRFENRWFGEQLGINLFPLKGSSAKVAHAIRTYPLYTGQDRLGDVSK